MQSINPTISVGTPGDDLHLHQKVQMGDRTLVDKPGDSILVPFMKGLYRLMTRGNLDNKPKADHDRVHLIERGSRNRYPGSSGDSVSLDTSSVPTLLTVSGTDFDLRHDEYGNDISEFSLQGGKAVVFWIESSVPQLNGAFHLEDDEFNKTPTQFPLYRVTEWTKDAKPASRTALDLSGETVDSVDIWNESTNYKQEVWKRGVYVNGDTREDNGPLVYPGITITRQSRPNKMNEYFWGYRADRELSTSGTSRSEATENENSSTITLSKDYTNNTGSDVTAEAIQIPARIFRSNRAVIARDLNQFTIPDGNTVTVKYEFTATNSGGGLMDVFMQLLKRRFDNGGEVTRVRDGNSVNQAARFWDFYSIPFSRRDVHFTESDDSVLDFDKVGPVIGTNDSAVNNTQHSLGSKIDNGVQSGQMIYEHVHPSAFRIDKANDECEFDLTRRFKNKSGSDITVREVGIYSGSKYTEFFENFPEGANAHMIARNTVGPTTVADGEVLEVTYTLKATL